MLFPRTSLSLDQLCSFLKELMVELKETTLEAADTTKEKLAKFTRIKMGWRGNWFQPKSLLTFYAIDQTYLLILTSLFSFWYRISIGCLKLNYGTICKIVLKKMHLHDGLRTKTKCLFKSMNVKYNQWRVFAGKHSKYFIDFFLLDKVA